MDKKRFLFISPHLDDAVLSCGGYIAKLRQFGYPVTVLTLFSGSPEGKLSILAKRLHTDWRLPTDAPAARRKEDRLALKIIDADMLHANYLDCIYRKSIKGQFIYKRIAHVLSQVNSNEVDFENEIANYLLRVINDNDWDLVFSPLALGGHVDHHIVKNAVQRIQNELPGKMFHFYEDLPYVISDSQEPQLDHQPAKSYLCLSDQEAKKKHKAMQAYRSQIKCKAYPTGIDIDAIIEYGLKTGNDAKQLGERIWY